MVRTLFKIKEINLGVMETEDLYFLGMVFVCPSCGDAWGTRSVEENGIQLSYVPKAVSCRFCGISSMINPFDKIEDLPYSVMEREIKCSELPHD